MKDEAEHEAINPGPLNLDDPDGNFGEQAEPEQCDYEALCSDIYDDEAGEMPQTPLEKEHDSDGALRMKHCKHIVKDLEKGLKERLVVNKVPKRTPKGALKRKEQKAAKNLHIKTKTVRMTARKPCKGSAVVEQGSASSR